MGSCCSQICPCCINDSDIGSTHGTGTSKSSRSRSRMSRHARIEPQRGKYKSLTHVESPNSVCGSCADDGLCCCPCLARFVDDLSSSSHEGEDVDIEMGNLSPTMSPRKNGGRVVALPAFITPYMYHTFELARAHPQLIELLRAPGQPLLHSDQSALLHWRAHKSSSGRRYFSNVLTGATTSHMPPGYDTVQPLLHIPALPSHLEHLSRLCSSRGVTLELMSAPLDDEVYGTALHGRPVSVWSALWYSQLLAHELSLYPVAFLRNIGLRRIILVEQLDYRGQPRKAVPIVLTGTLYLDARPEAVYYVQSVFHHELFHMFDDRVLLLMKYGVRWADVECPAHTHAQSKAKVDALAAPTGSLAAPLPEPYPYSATGNTTSANATSAAVPAALSAGSTLALPYTTAPSPSILDPDAPPAKRVKSAATGVDSVAQASVALSPRNAQIPVPQPIPPPASVPLPVPIPLSVPSYSQAPSPNSPDPYRSSPRQASPNSPNPSLQEPSLSCGYCGDCRRCRTCPRTDALLAAVDGVYKRQHKSLPQLLLACLPSVAEMRIEAADAAYNTDPVPGPRAHACVGRVTTPGTRTLAPDRVMVLAAHIVAGYAQHMLAKRAWSNAGKPADRTLHLLNGQQPWLDVALSSNGLTLPSAAQAGLADVKYGQLASVRSTATFLQYDPEYDAEFPVIDADSGTIISRAPNPNYPFFPSDPIAVLKRYRPEQLVTKYLTSAAVSDVPVRAVPVEERSNFFLYRQWPPRATMVTLTSLAAHVKARVASPHVSVEEASLHSINVEAVGADPLWLLLNSPGQRYGEGGHLQRHESATFSKTDGDAQLEGFQNEYSRSAIEEDKAEVYSGVVRHAPALLRSADRYLQAKAREMWRRLEMLGWDRPLYKHMCHSKLLPTDEDAAEHWERKFDARGYPFWYNHKTHQSSWFDPLLHLQEDSTDIDESRSRLSCRGGEAEAEAGACGTGTGDDADGFADGDDMFDDVDLGANGHDDAAGAALQPLVQSTAHAHAHARVHTTHALQDEREHIHTQAVALALSSTHAASSMDAGTGTAHRFIPPTESSGSSESSGSHMVLDMDMLDRLQDGPTPAPPAPPMPQHTSCVCVFCDTVAVGRPLPPVLRPHACSCSIH